MRHAGEAVTLVKSTFNTNSLYVKDIVSHFVSNYNAGSSLQVNWSGDPIRCKQNAKNVSMTLNNSMSLCISTSEKTTICLRQIFLAMFGKAVFNGNVIVFISSFLMRCSDFACKF